MSQPEENGSAAPSLASHYALHVALQTMKERCQTLQQRLTTVEEENVGLRIRLELDASDKLSTQPCNDVDTHRDRIAELTQQKSQLTDHINMVAKENRQLWSRLSKLTKDNQTMGTSLTKIRDTIDASSASSTHLIRSKTFTQNAPNPMLRHKMHEEPPENVSLEEISLKVLNEFLEGKAEVEKKCTEIIGEHNAIGFAYLNDSNAVIENGGNDLQVEIKKCIEEGNDLRQALITQQTDLNRVIGSLKQRKVMEVCPSCKNRKAGTTPKMADKNLSTEEEHPLLESTRSTIEDKSTVEEMNDGEAAKLSVPMDQTDLVEQKKCFDSIDKMCPMCGSVYSGAVSFDDFQDHVESHFIDDTEVESMEKTFEIMNTTVGNF